MEIKSYFVYATKFEYSSGKVELGSNNIKDKLRCLKKGDRLIDVVPEFGMIEGYNNGFIFSSRLELAFFEKEIELEVDKEVFKSSKQIGKLLVPEYNIKEDLQMVPFNYTYRLIPLDLEKIIILKFRQVIN